MSEFMTVSEIREALPFKIGERTLRDKLRKSGLAIEHRRQVALPRDRFPQFLEVFECSSSSSARTRPTGRSAARVRTPESASEKARRLIAEKRQLRSSRPS